MTTVCWDGKTMAADRQTNRGNMKHLVALQLLYTWWENREP